MDVLVPCAEAAKADASAISKIGCLACKHAPISNGCSKDPSNKRLTPGRTTSLESDSSNSCFPPLAEVESSKGCEPVTYTGLSAYDLQDVSYEKLVNRSGFDNYMLSVNDFISILLIFVNFLFILTS